MSSFHKRFAVVIKHNKVVFLFLFYFQIRFSCKKCLCSCDDVAKKCNGFEINDTLKYNLSPRQNDRFH